MEKLQHTITYKLVHSSVEQKFKIVSISDLHFSKYVKDKKLNSIFFALNKITPDYILIVGDLIDSIETIEKEEENKRLKSFLSKMASLAPVMIAKGNHDFTSKSKKKISRELLIEKSKRYFNELSHLTNIYVLDNEVYEDSRVYITGITGTPDYYHHKNKSIIIKEQESKEELIKILKEQKAKLHTLPKNKVCLAMLHSPIYLKEEKIQKELEEFDYILSGHMHNGCVPPIVNEIWTSSYGLIAPNKTLFPNNARNTLKKKEDKLIVNGALVTFQETAKWFQIFNFLFPIESTVLEFTDNEDYNTGKVMKKSKYYKIIK